MQRLIDLYRELSRRKVTRVAAGYVVIVWALSLGFAELFPVFGLSDWAIRAFIAAGLMGLPVAILLSWKYDLTSAGVVRDPMDFPGPPHTPVRLRSWCEVRQEGAVPVPLVASWQDAATGEQRKQRFTEALLIGREVANDISIADQRVSRLHALVWFEPTGWHVRDLDSSNGTFVNGEPLSGERRMPAVCDLRMHPKGPAVRLEPLDEERTLLTLHGVAEDEMGDRP